MKECVKLASYTHRLPVTVLLNRLPKRFIASWLLCRFIACFFKSGCKGTAFFWHDQIFWQKKCKKVHFSAFLVSKQAKSDDFRVDFRQNSVPVLFVERY